MIEILDLNQCPSWVNYPELYLKLINEEKDEFLPWYLTDKDDILWRLEGLKLRFPNRELYPFARKDYSDDVACWEVDKPGKVVIIHDYASPGWEQREIFDSFEDWYKLALEQKWDEEDEH